MKGAAIKEKSFLQDLAIELGQENLHIEMSSLNSVDLIVKNPATNKRIVIEFREGGHSGQLPLTIASALYHQKSKMADKDYLFLVTFSSISAYLQEKLQSLGIKSFARPTAKQVAQEVKQAIAA